MPQTPSTRWCPTPEQLMILEEMYRGGVRTPNASQIQQITTHLSLYGKIEGKNVFYWFQNHKARERQKLRRKLGRQQPPVPQSDEGSSAPSPPLLQNNQTPTNYLCQVGNLEGSAGSEEEEEEDATVSDVDARYAQPWMAMMEGSCSAGPPRCMPPLKTLDLFPTRSTGALRDECSSSKSSSCSTSN